MSRQWLRKIGLTLTNGGTALDLSQMHIRFNTTQMDLEECPFPRAEVTIFNLNPDTVKKIQDEYTEVILQAGYEGGDFGVIFKGTITLIRTGRFNALDSFVQLAVADGDKAQFSVVAQSVKAGQTPAAVAKALSKSTEVNGVKINPAGITGGVQYIRGKVLWGSAVARANELAVSQGGTYSIIDGQLVFTPLQGYQPGDIVVLNTETGLIGVPEATIEGIQFTSLLNSKIRLGQRVQINNKDINTTEARKAPTTQAVPLFADVTADGVYRAVVVEHQGDTRGQEWYTTMTGLSLDGSAGQVSKLGYKGVPAKASTDSN